MTNNNIANVFIRTRPGADTTITDTLLIEIGNAIQQAGMYVIRDKNEIDETTLVLALGGDGTMLSAMHIAAGTDATVTGFNYGNLGYLVPAVAKSSSELISKLTELLNDVTRQFDDTDFAQIKNLNAYKTTTYKLPILKWKNHVAINDFYFTPTANGSAADFNVVIDGSHFSTKSSGMVVSTPFGSTGLALSAGGSILSPNSGVLEVVPLLPHTLTSRPIIVPDSDTITVSWDQKVKVFADGRLIDDFGDGQVIIKCKKRKIKIVQPSNWDFFENLKNKMNWHS